MHDLACFLGVHAELIKSFQLMCSSWFLSALSTVPETPIRSSWLAEWINEDQRERPTWSETAEGGGRRKQNRRCESVSVIVQAASNLEIASLGGPVVG